MKEQSYIGKNLGNLRKQHGITQAELAEAVKVCTEHNARVENGSSNLSLPRLKLICDVLDVTPNDILAGDFKADIKNNKNMLPLDCINTEGRDLIERIYRFFFNNNEPM